VGQTVSEEAEDSVLAPAMGSQAERQRRVSEVSDTVVEVKGEGGVVDMTMPHPRLEPIVEEAEDGVCCG
jgi:hypothetical protein